MKKHKSLSQELRNLERADPTVAAAARSYDEAVDKILNTFPYHYRDDESRGPCPWSNTLRMRPDEPCPNGCAGAREHYVNDGHEECAE